MKPYIYCILLSSFSTIIQSHNVNAQQLAFYDSTSYFYIIFYLMKTGMIYDYILVRLFLSFCRSPNLSYGGGIGGIDGRPPHGGDARGRSVRTPSVVRRPFCGRGVTEAILSMYLLSMHLHMLTTRSPRLVFCHLQKLHGLSSVKLTAILQIFLKCTGKGKSI